MPVSGFVFGGAGRGSSFLAATAILSGVFAVIVFAGGGGDGGFFVGGNCTASILRLFNSVLSISLNIGSHFFQASAKSTELPSFSMLARSLFASVLHFMTKSSSSSILSFVYLLASYIA